MMSAVRGAASRSRRLVALGLAGILVLLGACSDRPEGEAVRTVEIDIRRSRFHPSQLQVPAGTRVRFVVVNADPIDHELIVGDAAVQARHEQGTEPHHGEVPGEVSVPAGGRAETSYLFAAPGTLLMGCHLPGHYAYGMRGSVHVTGLGDQALVFAGGVLL